MKRGMLLSWVAVVVAAVVTGGCGSDSPTAPSAGGVVVQGVVLGDGASVTAAADTQTASASAKKLTVRVDGTTLTVDVSANGTFELKGVPSGTFTLVFLADGVEVGRVEVSAPEGSEVKIVVQVTAASVLVVVELKVESPESQDGTTSSSCVVNGGKAGAGIELEGKVASGSATQFNLTATGRSSVDVVVKTASATAFTCVGSAKTTGDCKDQVTAGARVHVRGTLPSCTTAEVNATEVKVQQKS